VDVATRRIVAAKLAHYAAAPAAIVRRLARDVLEVAEPILMYSPRLTGSELLGIVTELGPAYASVVARRLRVGTSNAAPADAEARMNAATAKRAAAEPLSAAQAPLPNRAIDCSGTMRATDLRSGARLGDFFLAASSAQRRAILTELQDAADAPSACSATQASDAIRRLEAAALARKPLEFTRTLERTLGLSAQHARRIVVDEAGEPLLVALKALGMPAAVVLRILLFLNPVIGQSVTRVFDLAKLYDAMPRHAALQLIAGLRNDNATRRWANYRPMLSSDEPERGLAPEAARRAAGRTPTSSAPLAPAATTPSRGDKVEQV
jgi:uncharacterized protein (DUF2336 family)